MQYYVYVFRIECSMMQFDKLVSLFSCNFRLIVAVFTIDSRDMICLCSCYGACCLLVVVVARNKIDHMLCSLWQLGSFSPGIDDVSWCLIHHKVLLDRPKLDCVAVIFSFWKKVSMKEILVRSAVLPSEMSNTRKSGFSVLVLPLSKIKKALLSVLFFSLFGFLPK